MDPVLVADGGADCRMQKHIADAMREMLESFRLPGEAQQIARITETFASIYFAAKPGELNRASFALASHCQPQRAFKARMPSMSWRTPSSC